jgi:hypothetical protein
MIAFYCKKTATWLLIKIATFASKKLINTHVSAWVFYVAWVEFFALTLLRLYIVMLE